MDNHDEKIVEYLTQHKNILWTGILVIGGGLVGLVLTYSTLIPINSYSNITRIIFFILGCLLFIAMVIGLLNTDLDIKNFLKKGNKL